MIDYNLHQPEAHREDIEYVDEMFTMFRHANVTLGRQVGTP